MSGIGLHIEWQGMDRVQKAVQGVVDRFGGAKGHEEILDVIAGEIESQTKARIHEGGPDPEGKAWQRLSSRYQAWKRKHSTGNILNLRGDLLQSITHVVHPGDAEVGSNLIYAAIHQKGGDIKRGASSLTLRHRTDAKGSLLRTDLFGGKGLVFAKASHKRFMERTYSVGAYTIHEPARSFLGVSDENLSDLQGDVDAWADRLLEAACGH